MNDNRLKLMEAIARKRTVIAHYNGNQMKLAPHMLFERRGDLFISALNVTKNWRSLEERRLGQFKLNGLVATSLTDEIFEPLPDYAKAPPSSDDTLLLTVN